MRCRLKALVMAGGKGERLFPRVGVEKPLAKICGKPIILRVIEALTSSTSISEVIVAVSRHTPMTKNYVSSLNVKMLESPGVGYHEDLKLSLKTLPPATYFIASADLPLITPDDVDYIISEYFKLRKPALAVFIIAKELKSVGVKVRQEDIFTIEGVDVVPAGINIIDSQYIDFEEIDQANLILANAQHFINVNTEEELRIAEKLLCKT